MLSPNNKRIETEVLINIYVTVDLSLDTKNQK